MNNANTPLYLPLSDIERHISTIGTTSPNAPRNPSMASESTESTSSQVTIPSENAEAALLVFGQDLNIEEVPDMTSVYLEDAFDGIDAAFFSGDAFFDVSNRARAIAYLQRWGRELARLEDSSREELDDILKWVETLEVEHIFDNIQEIKGKSVTVIEDSSEHSSELTQTLYVTGIYGTSFSFTRKGLKVVEDGLWTHSNWRGWSKV